MWYTNYGMNIDHPEHTYCGVTKTLKIMSSKWTMLILHTLCESKKRFGELQRSLIGVSPKTLSIRLKQLEKEGIVTKHVFAEVPLHVEYSLTEKGASLKAIFSKIEAWGEKNESTVLPAGQ